MELVLGKSDLHDLSPSHENFDKSHLTDAEYSERLLFENRELKDDIRRQNEALKLLETNHEKTAKLLRKQLQEKDELIKSLQLLLRDSMLKLDTDKHVSTEKEKEKEVSKLDKDKDVNLDKENVSKSLDKEVLRDSASKSSDKDVPKALDKEILRDSASKSPEKEKDVSNSLDKDIVPKSLDKDSTVSKPLDKELIPDSTSKSLGKDKNVSESLDKEKTVSKSLGIAEPVVTPDIPLRSTRRRRKSVSRNDIKLEPLSSADDSSLENKTVESILENSPEIPADSFVTPKLRSTESKFDSSSVRTISLESNNSRVVSLEKPQGNVRLVDVERTTPRQMSSFTTPVSKSELAPEKHTPRQLDALLEKLSRKISSSSVLPNLTSHNNFTNNITNNAITSLPEHDTEDIQASLHSNDSKTNDSYDESLSKSLLNAHKNGTSTSSIRSYKSRLKLPPTMQKQQDQYELQHEQESRSQLDLSKDLENVSKASILEDLESIKSDKANISIDHEDEDTDLDLSTDTEPPKKSNNELPTVKSIAKPPPLELNKETLRSPAELQQGDYFSRNDKTLTPSGDNLSLAPSTNTENDYLLNVPKTPEAFGGKYSKNLLEDKQSSLLSPVNNIFHQSPLSQHKTPSNNSGLLSLHKPHSNTSFHVLPSPKAEDETPLFIQPEDFHTIYLHVVSTISVNSANQTQKNNDPNCTISILDRESDKEMWKIRKSYSQIAAFDNEIRPIVEYFGLPVIPEKSIFQSTTPTKVDQRREILQNYFNSLALLPHIPQLVLLRICRYISLDFVNPLDDFKSGARKEGFLLRRYKGLGSNWKVRWCQADGPYLDVYENPGGQLLEQIKLKGAQIGRQNTDSVAEDKGYRHAFLIMEGRKNSKLSSSLPKHFFCAESDEERDSWVNLLLEYNDPGDASSNFDVDSTLTNTPNNYVLYDENVDGLQNDSTSSIPLLADNVYSTYQTGFNHGNSSTSNNTSTNDTLVTYLDEEPSKKTIKKKSFLSFINKSNTDEDLHIAPPTRVDTSMQQYLDQMKLDDNDTEAIFGRELLVSYGLSNNVFDGKSIPSIIYRCLDFFSKTGAIYEEGIFRLSGSASTIKKLKENFNKSFDLDLFQSSLKPDMHTVSGLFKTYLRELPSPIIGRQPYQYLNSMILNNKNISPSATAILFRDYFNNPDCVDDIHYNTSYVIFKFLKIIIKNNKVNRMNLRNVCIVFVPTLNMSLEVLSVFLTDFDCIFENQSPIPDNQREILDLVIPNF